MSDDDAGYYGGLKCPDCGFAGPVEEWTGSDVEPEEGEAEFLVCPECGAASL